MDHFILIRSNQSNEYFPNYTSYHFKVRLSDPLLLDGNWRIAIIDFYTKDKIIPVRRNNTELYLFCDIYSGINVLNNRYSLLRRIFSPPIYLPVSVKRSELYELEFHIKDENGEDASFLKSTSSFTLHLKRYPLYA